VNVAVDTGYSRGLPGTMTALAAAK
jgi:hypothetical protein